MLEIDGSYLEGGGSIIRLACAFSAVTGKEIKITNIRAKRANPGLQAQHVTSVKAIAKFCNARFTGVDIGSEEIEFYPGKLEDCCFEFDIGTAGSISLVLQAIMIPAMYCDCKLEIKGGTFVKFAPPVSYLQNVTLLVLRKFGYKGDIEILKHGFYPKGGGIVSAEFRKSALSEINILKKGKPMDISCVITISNDLESKKVAERIEKYCKEYLFKSFNLEPKIKIEYVHSMSTGGGLNISVVYENCILGSNCLLDIKKSSEHVAIEAVNNILEQDKFDVPIDEYLEDQLIPYLAIFGGQIKVHALTNHTKTNIWLAEQFFPVKFEIEDNVIKCSKQI